MEIMTQKVCMGADILPLLMHQDSIVRSNFQKNSFPEFFMETYHVLLPLEPINSWTGSISESHLYIY